MANPKRHSFYIPEKLHELIRELTPEHHTLISTVWDALEFYKEHKEGKEDGKSER